MKLAIMQPYFFPYIGYFQLIGAVDRFVVYDDVSFINKGWIHRNNIIMNGCKGFINVPLIGASQNKLIKDIIPTGDDRWKFKLLKTIEHNYKNAPHFANVYRIIEGIINSHPVNISEFNVTAIKTLCEYLSIPTMIISSSDLYGNIALKGQYRILDICRREGATSYINPIGGIELYEKELFRNAGIQLCFLKAESIEYKQSRNTDDFIPNLSIIDVLMNNSVSDCQGFLTKYELI